MGFTDIEKRQTEMFSYILEFVERAPGLEAQFSPQISTSLALIASRKPDSPDTFADTFAGQPFEDSFVDEPLATRIHLRQKIDGKSLLIEARAIAGLLPRYDQDGEEFLQINFEAGYKILVTKNLIGFKPVLGAGVDKANLPNVVTTPDILNVLDAIHEATEDGHGNESDIRSLRKVFEAVILGGELVGFDLSQERSWLRKSPVISAKVSS